LKAKATDAPRAVRVNAEKVRDRMRLKWISEKGMRFQVQSSNDRTTWRKVGVVRKGTGESDSVVVPASGPRYVRVVRVDSPKLPAPVCGNKFYKRAPSNPGVYFRKKSPMARTSSGLVTTPDCPAARRGSTVWIGRTGLRSG
jgi:hypothetical protein